MHRHRKLPVGAELLPDGGSHFRVWAPKPKRVELVIEDLPGQGAGRAIAMQAEGNGYYACTCPEAGAGTRYRFRLDGDDKLYPDPASRYQPEGPHGPSQVIDPAAFHWTDDDWRGAPEQNRVLWRGGVFAAGEAQG